MTNKVSVIITCHNLEKFIASAIESVCAQSFEGNVEVIVVDDASTDGSREVIEQYSQVKMLRTESNVGVLMATVLGLRHATGEYLFFLDGDDYWDQDKLRLCVSELDNNRGVAFVTHDLRYVDGEGALISRASRPAEVLSGGGNVSHLIVRGILEHKDYVWLGSAYGVRRSLIDLEAFCNWAEALPDPLNTYQDWPLAYWVASLGELKMAYVPQKLFSYRLHGSNYSGDSRDLQKAIRNVRRTTNTMRAIREIVEMRNLKGRAVEVTLRKLYFYQYLLDLYSGKRIVAMKGFFHAQPYVLRNTTSALKEWLRFVSVLLLGAERFLKMASVR